MKNHRYWFLSLHFQKSFHSCFPGYQPHLPYVAICTIIYNEYMYIQIHMCIYPYITCWTLRLLFKSDITLLDSVSLGSSRGQNAHHCCVNFNMGNCVKMRMFTKNKLRMAPKTVKSVKLAWWLQKDTKEEAQCQCTQFTGHTWESKKKQSWPNSKERLLERRRCPSKS